MASESLDTLPPRGNVGTRNATTTSTQELCKAIGTRAERHLQLKGVGMCSRLHAAHKTAQQRKQEVEQSNPCTRNHSAHMHSVGVRSCRTAMTLHRKEAISRETPGTRCLQTRCIIEPTKEMPRCPRVRIASEFLRLCLSAASRSSRAGKIIRTKVQNTQLQKLGRRLQQELRTNAFVSRVFTTSTTGVLGLTLGGTKVYASNRSKIFRTIAPEKSRGLSQTLETSPGS